MITALTGTSALSCRDVSQAMAQTTGRKARFAPWLFSSFKASADALARSSSKNIATQVGSLISVFLPYIAWDTVFDNTRAVTEVGVAPVPFDRYCGPLYTWSKQNKFEWNAKPLSSAAPTKVGATA